MDETPVDWTRVILLFAFVAITFVNWLVSKIQERRAAKRLERDGGRHDEPLDDADEDEDATPPPAPVQRPRSSTPGRSKAEEELRRFFDALGLPSDDATVREEHARRLREERTSREATPPPPPPVPPPIPEETRPSWARARQERPSQTGSRESRSTVASPLDRLTPQERQALRRLETSGHFARRIADATHPADHARREQQAAIRRLLANPKSIRHAILMREILDPPRGLQSRDTLTNF